MRQIEGYLSLQCFLIATCLVGTEHEVVGAYEAPVKLAIRKHVLFPYVLSVIGLKESDKIIAASGWTLTRVDILVVMAASARHYLHVLVCRV